LCSPWASPHTVRVPTHPAIPRPHAFMDRRYNSSFFNSEFKFLLINESNFHVAGFSYGATTRDVVGRVSRSRATSNVAAAASRWILAITIFKWILATAATSFFAIDDKSFMPTFNCSIHNTSKCRTSRLLVHFCLQASFIIGRTRIYRRDPKHGRIQ
jgi:hypothetical protein